MVVKAKGASVAATAMLTCVAHMSITSVAIVFIVLLWEDLPILPHFSLQVAYWVGWICFYSQIGQYESDTVQKDNDPFECIKPFSI